MAKQYAGLLCRDFYLEVQPNGLADQDKVNADWPKHNVPGDRHSLSPHRRLPLRPSDRRQGPRSPSMAIQQGRTLADEKRLKHDVSSYYLHSRRNLTRPSPMPQAWRAPSRSPMPATSPSLGKPMLPQIQGPRGLGHPVLFRRVCEEAWRAASRVCAGQKFDVDQYRAQLSERSKSSSRWTSRATFSSSGLHSFTPKARYPVGLCRGSGV